MNETTLAVYWNMLPVGRDRAASYEDLQLYWSADARRVRKILEELSRFDNGDNYVLIRSSRGIGFYRTDDPDDIAAYKREVKSRVRKISAPLKKINRVLNDILPADINYSFENNLKLVRRERNMRQACVVAAMKEYDPCFDVSTLSRFENGWALPTPAQLRGLSIIYGCAPSDLVAMAKDLSEIYAS